MARQKKRRFSTKPNPTYQIKTKSWKKYTGVLKQLSDTASSKLEDYIRKGHTEQEILDYAYALVQRYGEASAEMTCQMYEALADYSGTLVAAAEPAAIATYSETAKQICGTMLRTKDAATISASAGRLVKLASVDTMMKNALRDGCEWAWIPAGDSCAFCTMLASRGWVKASEDLITNGHMSHIHSNCDCTFCVRHDKNVTVEGYDPDALYEEYSNAGDTKWERINAMRRQHYAANKDYINAQKRAAYAARMERERGEKAVSTIVDKEHIRTQTYRMQFHGITGDAKVDDRICEHARSILDHRTGTNKEDLVLLDAKTGNLIHLHNRSIKDGGIAYDDAVEAAIQEAHRRGQKIVAIHNHPSSVPPTMDDGASAFDHGYDVGIVVGHDGSVYQYTKTNGHYEIEDCEKVHAAISYQIKTGAKLEDVWYNMLKEYGMVITRR